MALLQMPYLDKISPALQGRSATPVVFVACRTHEGRSRGMPCRIASPEDGTRIPCMPIMLIVSIIRVQGRLDILISLVIVAIIATAGYIGYHASQETEPVDKNDITIVPEALEDAQPVHALEEIVVPSRI